MNQGFPGQWAKHIDAVWGAQQRRTAGGPFGPGGGPAGGPPPWLAGLFGMGQGGPEAKPRARRGDVRSAILDVVRAAAERGEPVNGYQVIQQIAERSEEAWRPSPGSVYPTISQLEDEGLLVTDETLGRKSLRLTAAGEAYVAEHAAELAAVWTPFQQHRPGADQDAAAGDGSGASWRDLKPEIGQMMSAVWQIVTSGSETQKTAAAAVLVETRRKLYGILADGEHPTADPADPAADRTADQIAGEQAEGPR